MALVVQDVPCLVVGAGRVGSRKAFSLLDAGADVIVVAPDATLEVRDAAERAQLSWIAREVRASDVMDANFVFTATGDPVVDGEVAVWAREQRRPVNSADDPENCDFYLAALVRRGPIVGAISSSGVSPALASYLARRTEQLWPEGLGELAERLGELRRRLQSRDVGTESLDWTELIDDDLVASVGRGEWSEVENRIARFEERAP